MRFFSIIIIAGAMYAGAANADDSPEGKLFAPVSPAYKNVSDSASLSSATPHFFPLPPRRIAALTMPINRTAAAQEEDFPKPSEKPPEAMTQDQARQILSLFGGGE